MSIVPPSQSKSGAPSLKLLITAGALAATLGGWAALATAPAPTNTNQVASATTSSSQWAFKLPALPTIVAPFSQSQATTAVSPNRSSGVGLRAVQPPPLAVTRSSR